MQKIFQKTICIVLILTILMVTIMPPIGIRAAIPMPGVNQLAQMWNMTINGMGGVTMNEDDINSIFGHGIFGENPYWADGNIRDWINQKNIKAASHLYSDPNFRNAVGLGRMKNVNVPGRGNVQVQYAPIIMSEGTIMELMQGRFSWISSMNELQMLFDGNAERGYFFCFINQDFRPLPIPPHFLFEGYCEETGVPVLYRGYSDVHFLQAIGQHAVLGFEDYTVSITPSPRTGWTDVRARRGGDVLWFRDYWVRPRHYGFVRIRERITGLRPSVSVVYGWFHADGGATVTTAEVSRRLTTQGVVDKDGENNPFIPRLLDLKSMNMLNNKAGVMDAIRTKADHPDRTNDNVGVTMPLITPDAFPEVSEEDWPRFLADLLAALMPSDFVMTWEQLQALLEQLTIPTVYTPDVTIPYPDVGTSGIIGWLQRIYNRLVALSGAIAIAIVGDMVINWEPLRIQVYSVFPFSIPWDLRNAFSAMFGGEIAQPTNPMGLNMQEYTYINAAIEPMNISFSTMQAPVFEAHIPFGEFGYTFVLDLGDYHVIVLVLRWFLMGSFVLSLITLTGRLIQW